MTKKLQIKAKTMKTISKQKFSKTIAKTGKTASES